MPRAEFQLFINDNGSIEIVDPISRKEAFADENTEAAMEINEMLVEAEMI